jgi:hypothetical protein
MTQLSRHLSIVLALVGSVTFAAAAAAQELTLRWLASDGSLIAERTLDVTGVEALPQQEIATTTPWTDGGQTFTGPSLGDLAGLVAQPVAEAQVFALNDYSATVPAEDWTERGAILAARHNGNTMEIRDKGPFWIMYPIDSSAEFDTQVYHARMVWQVRGIDFIAN